MRTAAPVLAGALLAAVLAAIVLRVRHYRRLHEEEQADTDRDGIPDVYDTEPSSHSGRPVRSADDTAPPAPAAQSGGTE